MPAIIQDLVVEQGATFRWPFYWYSDEETVVTITAIAATYPVVVTAAAHGLPDSAVPIGLLEVPAYLETVGPAPDERILPSGDKAYALKLTADTFKVMQGTQRAVDGTGEEAYTGTAGRAVFNVPMDLGAWDARMQIRESVDADDVLIEFSSNDGSIVLDDEGKVELVLTADDTTALDFTSAVYQLELVDPITDEVVRLARGKVALSPEVTRA